MKTILFLAVFVCGAAYADIAPLPPPPAAARGPVSVVAGIAIASLISLLRKLRGGGDPTRTPDRYKRNTVLAAAVVLFLCLLAVVAVRFRTYDPATPADSDTLFDYCILAGMALLPIASVCFARSLFIGQRFRFLLSWLAGFLIPWAVLVYEIFYPKTPPEGSYFTREEACIEFTILVAIITGVINVFDSLVERLLAKSDNILSRNWHFIFVARFVGTIMLLALVVVFFRVCQLFCGVT